jgi:hypothetical protein
MPCSLNIVVGNPMLFELALIRKENDMDTIKAANIIIITTICGVY